MSDDELDMAAAMGEMDAGAGDEMDMAAAMGSEDMDMSAAMGEMDMGGAVPSGRISAQRQERADEFSRIGRFDDIDVTVDAVLGRVSMPIEQFLKLGRGAIVELEQTKEDDLDLAVNGVVVARGEITVLEENVGVTVKQIARKNKMYGVEGVGVEAPAEEGEEMDALPDDEGDAAEPADSGSEEETES